MFRFKNASCPYCHKIFEENDDIVVCPECGTPHHRECYIQHGNCANAAQHSEQFQWEAPANSDGTNSESAAPVVCPHCGRDNHAGNKFCNYCGSPIENVPEPVLFGVQMPSINDEEEIDGFKVKHIRKYIGSNWQFYVYQFLIQNKFSRKVSFTFSAMIFPTLYFLYRKLWRMALLSFIVSTLTVIPVTAVQLAELGYALFGVSANTWYSVTPYVSAVSMGFCIFCGLFSTWMYRKSCIKSLIGFKTRANNEDEFESLITKNSGPSKKAVIIGLIAIAVVTLVISLMISVALLQ